ncbi:MAG: hypothetical protein LBQ00_00095 [Syntrophobacterales bacterium]|nr:hypothetical protein [Syntrophobacterales bacterium]
MQPKDRSNGGKLYIYDKGLNPEHTRRLHWRNISSTDYHNFLAFLDIVKGAKYDFTFTDFDGATYTARIINGDSIDSAPVMAGRESLTVDIVFE